MQSSFRNISIKVSFPEKNTRLRAILAYSKNFKSEPKNTNISKQKSQVNTNKPY